MRHKETQREADTDQGSQQVEEDGEDCLALHRSSWQLSMVVGGEWQRFCTSCHQLYDHAKLKHEITSVEDHLHPRSVKEQPATQHQHKMRATDSCLTSANDHFCTWVYDSHLKNLGATAHYSELPRKLARYYISAESSPCIVHELACDGRCNQLRPFGLQAGCNCLESGGHSCNQWPATLRACVNTVAGALTSDPCQYARAIWQLQSLFRRVHGLQCSQRGERRTQRQKVAGSQ